MMLTEDHEFKRIVYRNFVNAFCKFSDQVIQQHGCLWIESSTMHPLFNVVLSNSTVDDIEQTISQVKHKFHQRGRPLSWWVSDFSDAGLPKALNKNNLNALDGFAGMICDMNDVPKMDIHHDMVQIKQITQRDMLPAWLQPIVISFEFSEEMANFYLDVWEKHFDDPSVIHIGAFKGDEIIGTGTLFLEPESCGFYNLAVLPEYRNHGIGTLIQQFRLQLAKSLGVKYATLQASTMAEHLDQLVGFKKVITLTPYVEQS